MNNQALFPNIIHPRAFLLIKKKTHSQITDLNYKQLDLQVWLCDNFITAPLYCAACGVMPNVLSKRHIFYCLEKWSARSYIIDFGAVSLLINNWSIDKLIVFTTLLFAYTFFLILLLLEQLISWSVFSTKRTLLRPSIELMIWHFLYLSW